MPMATMSDCSHGPRPRDAAQSRNRAVNLKCSNSPHSATVISVDQSPIQ